jgi:VanZ family protein
VKTTHRLLAIESRLLLILAVLYINIQATTPAICDYGFTMMDKAEHFLGFYVLSVLLDFSFPRQPFNALKIIVLLAYGAGIEGVQLYIPFRECSFLDFFADVSGLCVYWSSIPLLKRLPLIRLRWMA